MKVLVDTSVWSLALRRKEESETVRKLTDLIKSSLVVMIGPVRQELLSGIADENTFNNLRMKLDAFDDLPLKTRDYITVAQFFNTCRRHGIQGSHTDFLICAAAANNELSIFTTDADFQHYAGYLPVRLI